MSGTVKTTLTSTGKTDAKGAETTPTSYTIELDVVEANGYSIKGTIANVSLNYKDMLTDNEL
jgi:hypothetical protein